MSEIPPDELGRALVAAVEALRILIPIVGELNARVAMIYPGYAERALGEVDENLRVVSTLLERTAEQLPPELVDEFRRGGGF